LPPESLCLLGLALFDQETKQTAPSGLGAGVNFKPKLIDAVLVG
jgi:hypothetical protein